jgi:hypothetical protein
VDGSYEVTVANEFMEPGTPVVVGEYTTDDALAITLVLVVVGSTQLGAAGLVTLVVGLLLRRRSRRLRVVPSV